MKGYPMYSLSLHENKQHGTLEFPAEYHFIDSGHPRYNMPFHWHKEWELIRIVKGSFSIHADETEFFAKEGDILLLRDGMLHGGTPKDCVYECFLFDLHGLFRNLDVVKKYLRPIYRLQLLPQIYYSGAASAEISEIVGELMDVYHRQLTADSSNCAVIDDSKKQQPDESNSQPLPSYFPGDFHELITISCISRLFTVILQKGSYILNEEEALSNSHRIDQVKSVLEYIEGHYTTPISLDDLAKEAGMNPKYFCRFFRSITHQTPLDYVNNYRVEQAAQKLLTTDLSVTDISLECGFNDSSYFVKVFRKYRGLTPNQYRKANQFH